MKTFLISEQFEFFYIPFFNYKNEKKNIYVLCRLTKYLNESNKKQPGLNIETTKAKKKLSGWEGKFK